MKAANIQTFDSSSGEHLMGVVCRDGHTRGIYELTMVVNGAVPEKSIRQRLTAEWERHRREHHGGA